MASSILLRSSLRVVLASTLFCVPFTFGQEAPAPAPAPTQGGGGGGAGGTGGNPGGGAGSIGTGGQRPGNQQPQQIPGQRDQRDPFGEMMQNRPVFLSGKVVMDDGTPPPDAVTIERVCGTTVRPEGYTDSKGRFSFQLGQNQGMMADASMSSADTMGGMPGRGGMMGGRGGGVSERDLTGCELRASLAGFRSEPVNLSGRRALDNPDVGTIILHRLAKVEGFTFSGTTAFAPKDAKKAYEKGQQAAKKKKWAEAEENLQKATATYPKYAAAWYELGTVYQQQAKIEDARKAYQESIKADEKYVTPYAQLARLAGAEQKWEDVATYTGKVIKLNPYFSPDIYYVGAVANFNLQKADQAEEYAREALKLDAQKRNPRINHLLGVILAHKEAYPEAAENMRAFLKRVPEGPDAENVKKQLAEVERRMGANATASGQQAAQ